MTVRLISEWSEQELNDEFRSAHQEMERHVLISRCHSCHKCERLAARQARVIREFNRRDDLAIIM